MLKRFTAGMAVGYVLGARAGEKRYDQISDLAERALEMPFVERLTDAARTMAMDQGRRALAGIKNRAQWDPQHDHGEAGDAEDLAGDEQEDAEEMESDDVEDEPSREADEEVDDVEDYADESDDGDDGPSGDEDREPTRRQGAGEGRSRRRIGSLAAAARERGRVA